MPVSRPQLSPQLSPQMRPPSCQPPALPCGQPQDQLGNVARCHSHIVLLSLGLSLSSCTRGGVAGWQGLGGSCTPSAPACLLGSFFLHGASSPFLLQLPELPSQGRQKSLCGSPGPRSWWWPPQHLPEAIVRSKGRG